MHSAAGKQKEAEVILKENLDFTEHYGSIILNSEHLVSDVTAMQLAYILDDKEMCQMIATSLNAKGKILAKEQIAQKRLEIIKQTIEFDLFEDLCDVITKDEMLQENGNVNDETQQVLEKFQDFFKPGMVEQGKPFDIRHLWYAYDLYAEHQHFHPLWKEHQNEFFVREVMIFLQRLVSPFYAQAFSQGIYKMVIEHEPLHRSILLENKINTDELFYFPSGSDPWSRQFFVEVGRGHAIKFNNTGSGLGFGGMARGTLKKFIKNNLQSMEQFDPEVLDYSSNEETQPQSFEHWHRESTIRCIHHYGFIQGRNSTINYNLKGNESISIRSEYTNYDKKLRIQIRFSEDLFSAIKDKLTELATKPIVNSECCKFYLQTYSNECIIVFSKIKPGYKLELASRDILGRVVCSWDINTLYMDIDPKSKPIFYYIRTIDGKQTKPSVTLQEHLASEVKIPLKLDQLEPLRLAMAAIKE